jgi:hypothetical protein
MKNCNYHSESPESSHFLDIPSMDPILNENKELKQSLEESLQNIANTAASKNHEIGRMAIVIGNLRTDIEAREYHFRQGSDFCMISC